MKLFILSAFTFLFTACATTQKTTSPQAFYGEWDVVSIQGEKIVPSDKTPYLGFDVKEQRVYGFTGCNRLTGGINAEELSKGVADFSRMGSTRMACFEDKYETKFLSAMGEVAKVKAKGKTLSLCNASGKVVVELVKRDTPRK